MAPESSLVVLDTNIVLDLLVFDDAKAQPLRDELQLGRLRWIATRPMRDELERVLAYPHIAARLLARGILPGSVLGAFDRQAVLLDRPETAALACSDADDQKFIDLAVAHQCALLSKDAAVLSMKKRLAAVNVSTAAAFGG